MEQFAKSSGELAARTGGNSVNNRYKEQYDQRKESVLTFLDNSIQQLRDWGQEEDAVPLEKLRDNVSEGLFSIVLVGEFSAGKSTFLNAMMHKRILPFFTSETTATVNFLRHTDQATEGATGRVFFRDGRIENLHDLERATLERFVSTNGDNGDKTVAEAIDHVDLFLDSEFLKNGVMLVDSPGLNGMREYHREITEQQIKSSHACIFMFRAEQPGSKTEFDTLHQLKNQSNNIFFVMNKIDAIRSSENQTVDSVIQNLRQTYQQQFPDERELPKIWPVSSLAALVARDSEETEYLGNEIVTTQERRDELEAFSRMGAFEDRLWKYLTEGERSRDQLCGPVSAAVTQIVQGRDFFDTQIQLLQDQTNAEELRKQKEDLEENLNQLKKNRKSISPALNQKVSICIRNQEECVGRQMDAVRQSIESQLNASVLPEDFESVVENLPSFLDSKFTRLGKSVDDALRRELMNAAEEEYEAYVQDMEEQLDSMSGDRGFKFVSPKIHLDNMSIGVNLEKFDADCKCLQDQINDLEQQKEQAEVSAIQARRMERKLQEKQEELKDLRQSKQFIQENFVAPEAVTRSKEVDASYWRSGVLGMVGNLLFGKKQATRWTDYIDTSARDEAVEQHRKRLTEVDEEIRRIKEEQQNMPKPQESSEEQELKFRRAQEKLKKREEELRKLQETHLKDIAQKTRRACKRWRRDILEQVDQTIYEVQDTVKQYLVDKKKDYLHAVRDLVNTSLDQEIASAQRKLDDIMEVLQSEGEDRERQLKKYQCWKEQAKSLIDEGTALCAMLKEAMDDHVEQEAL